MNVKEAMLDTLVLAREHGMDNVLDEDRPSLDYQHLLDMFNTVQSKEMSYGKLCRWLGWMQAAVVAGCEGVTLEAMKEINKRHAGE